MLCLPGLWTGKIQSPRKDTQPILGQMVFSGGPSLGLLEEPKREFVAGEYSQGQGQVCSTKGQDDEKWVWKMLSTHHGPLTTELPEFLPSSPPPSSPPPLLPSGAFPLSQNEGTQSVRWFEAHPTLVPPYLFLKLHFYGYKSKLHAFEKWNYRM